MSALPPKADMLIVGIDVCYVPKADIRIDRQIYGHASNVPACEPCDSTITPGAGPLANATALRANTAARRRSGFELPVSIRQPRGFKICAIAA